MKANIKFREDCEAVSAVIGVILMVAITVAIAATVYVYVSGMIGGSPDTTPNVQFVQDVVGDTLTVASAEPTNLVWGDCSYSMAPDTTSMTLSGWGTTTQDILAGDQITVTGSGDISVRHDDTNTLLGTWTFP